MFNELITMLSTDIVRAIIIIIGLCVILGLTIWISVIDIKDKAIEFWKMLVASSSTIIMPFIASFFCGCRLLKWFLLGSLVIWFLFLFINIKFNKDKIVGKADVDLLSAILAETIMFSVWTFITSENANAAWIKITAIWYNLLFFLLAGALLFLAVFMLIFIVNVIRKKNSFKNLRKMKVSVIPMFIPVSVMMPYLFMVS